MAFRWSAALLLVLCSALACGHARAEDDAPTDVPDPVGLGERLALIDYLHDHGRQVEAGADLASLRHEYRALTAKAAPSAEQAARDAAALELWRTYGESATPDETLAQLRARLDKLAAKAASAHQQELAHEADDAAAADAAPPPPSQNAQANPAALRAAALAKQQAAQQAAQAAAQPAADMPPPTGKPGADGAWTTDVLAAAASAKDLGRPLLIDFTGSDWCSWCMKLEREVFVTPAFVAWAARHVVLMRADFPKKTQLPKALAEQNDMLAQRFGIKGFPTVEIIAISGAYLGSLGYQEGGPDPWIAAASKMMHL